MSKKPSIQFYPGDWRKEPTVSCLSLAAKGLWWEMLLLMHEAPQRGVLAMKPIGLSRVVGAKLSEVNKLLSEMETAGTFSRNSEGLIFNRRMVRDEALSAVRSNAGKNGADHRWSNSVPSVCHEDLDSKNENLPLPRARATEVEIEVEVEAYKNLPSESLENPKIKSAKPPVEQWFVEFWALYWRKIARAKSFEMFKKHATSEEKKDQIIAAVIAQSPQYLARDSDHRPYASSWLNARGYEDDPEQHQPAVTERRQRGLSAEEIAAL